MKEAILDGPLDCILLHVLNEDKIAVNNLLENSKSISSKKTNKQTDRQTDRQKRTVYANLDQVERAKRNDEIQMKSQVPKIFSSHARI